MSRLLGFLRAVPERQDTGTPTEILDARKAQQAIHTSIASLRRDADAEMRTQKTIRTNFMERQIRRQEQP